MGNEIELVHETTLAIVNDLDGLVERFLNRRKATTQRNYADALKDFRRFVGAETDIDAARALLAHGHGAANVTADSYRQELLRRGLSSGTVNTRLAALRSLVAMAGLAGMVPWKLEITSEKHEAYRDTRGPGTDGFRAMLAAVEGLHAKATRDRALLHLMYDLALRRAEVVALDVEDVDFQAGTVSVVGKGKTQAAPLTLPGPTRAALADWVAVRPDVTDRERRRPLFTNCDRAQKGDRLTGTAVFYLVRSLGEKVGLKTRPHGIRHAAITAALDATKGDVRAVRRFSRHAKLETLNVYDDNRTDMGGQVAALVAGQV